MNHNNVISLPNSGTALAAFTRVKVGAGPVVLPAESADAAVATVLQDTAPNGVAGLQLIRGTCHYATIGSSAAISPGDELQSAPGGRLVKKAEGAAVAVALQAASAEGHIIEVIYY